MGMVIRFRVRIANTLRHCFQLVPGIYMCPGLFFMVRLPKNRVVVLQFRLTSKSLSHSKCHVISLVDAIGFNLYNRCASFTDNRTKPFMFNSCDTGQNRCRMTAIQSQLQLRPIAAMIAMRKHRVRVLTKPCHKRLTSFF